MEITPSILTADFTRLGETLEEAVAAGIDWIHMDVMDGNWVVNRTITFGPALIRSVRCLLYTSPSPRDRSLSRMPSSA